MQLAIDVSLSNILNLISQMSSNELKEIKKKIAEQEIFFKELDKDSIESIDKKDSDYGYILDARERRENGEKSYSLESILKEFK